MDEETRKQFSKKELKELATQEIKKINELANAYHVYQQLLLDNNALDFGDLIIYCLKLFRERPMLLARYRQQFKYILVDEFQDTNWAQYELVKLLASPQNNITVVGDDDQSIYKFRGASVSNILEFKKDFPDSEEVVLVKNYRSAQNILDLSYKFIKQNDPNRLEYQLCNGDKTAKKSKGKSSKVCAAGLNKKISKKLKANNNQDGEIMHLHAETNDDEVKLVIEKITMLRKADSDATWNDFAILVRANDSANIFISGLSTFGIPYQFVASRGLYTKSVVVDIMSYLRLLDDYHESSALYRIMSMPVFAFDHRQIINLNYWAKRKNWSLYETLQRLSTLPNIFPETITKAKKIISLLDKHAALISEKNVSEIVYYFLEESGYLKFLTQRDDAWSRQQVSYLNQFYKKIKDFEQNSDDKSVKSFLNNLNLEIEAGEQGSLVPVLDDGPEAIKIMTVHAAKGLEFKYVFIANMVDRRFPTTERKDPIELPDSLVKEIVPQGDIHLQEERRLFYVAMTRAKSGLYFTSAENYGGQMKKKLSRFLTELNEFGLKLAAGPHARIKSSIEVINNQEADLSYAIPKKFSFSQLRAFETCPWQYRYSFILSIPIKGKAVFSFGQTIHSTLQKFFQAVMDRTSATQRDLFGQVLAVTKGKKIKAKDVISVDELIKIYENCWIDDWYQDKKQKNEYYKKGVVILKDLYKSWENNLPIPKSLEQWFDLKLHDNGEMYTLTGRIDRIDEGADGKLEIIDYKTGAPKYEEKMTAEDKEQLLLYQLAAKELFGDNVSALTFHYVEKDHKVSFLGTDKELGKMKERSEE
ncbi:MAG: ATP-dependent helicase, partial [Patescibacteria group bacterium]|nr:ATP-dependent helicase [Patescibacteria group bacterium]